jgi:hypothetical protein
VNTWSALGIFLLGTDTGALVTVVIFSAQIHELKVLVNALSTEHPETKPQIHQDADEKRKSA